MAWADVDTDIYGIPYEERRDSNFAIFARLRYVLLVESCTFKAFGKR
jgi:hypothetical protein